MQDLHYWDCLSLCGMYSTERRVERYRIIYMWKMVRGLVPNCGLSWGVQGRRGLLVQLPQLSGSRQAIRTLRERAYMTEAPRLFNSLPATLRGHKGSVLSFKRALDELLGSCPDAPLSLTRHSLATTMEGAPSNSIKDWLRIRSQPTYSRLLAETALGYEVSQALSLGTQ